MKSKFCYSKTIISLIASFLMAVVIFMPSYTQAAQNTKFDYRNVTLGKNLTYNAISPTYTINGKTLDLKGQLAIINENGAAMGSANAIFRDGIGASVTYNTSLKRLTITYDNQKLVLFVGEKTCYLNDNAMTVTNPIFRAKYNNDVYATMVPTRFVAETLGFKYDYSDGKVSITVPTKLHYDNKDVIYKNDIPMVYVNGNLVDTSSEPCYLLLSNTMAKAETVLSADSKINWSYDKNTGDIEITRGDITLKLKEGERYAYMNNILIQAPVEPLIIKNYLLQTESLYIPLDFVFSNLGYKYSYSESATTAKITTKDSTGKYSGLVPFKITEASHEDSYYAKYAGTADEFKQSITLTFPESVNPKDVNIIEKYFDNTIRFEIQGDHTKFYKKNSLTNSGKAIRRIQYYYDKDKDITIIDLVNRSNQADVILVAKYTYKTNSIKVSLNQPKNYYSKIIVLDAGHGGNDPGANYSGVKEKDLNFNIINYAKKYFDDSYKTNNIKVFTTRSEDVLIPLYQRANFAERMQADMFVSVHQNANNSSAVNGTSVYYCSTNEYTYGKGLDSHTMAKTMSKPVSSSIGIKNIGAIDAAFVVIREAHVPAILIETCFLTNSKDVAVIKQTKNQKAVGKAIYNTVLDFYKDYEIEEESVQPVG